MKQILDSNSPVGVFVVAALTLGVIAFLIANAPTPFAMPGGVIGWGATILVGAFIIQRLAAVLTKK